MRILFLILVLLFTPSLLWGSNWKEMWGPDKDRIYYMDTLSFNYSKEIVQSWIKIEGISNKKLDYTQMKLLLEIDCSKMKIRILSHIFYNEDGEVKNSTSNENAQWNFIIPDSNGESFHAFLCGLTDVIEGNAIK